MIKKIIWETPLTNIRKYLFFSSKNIFLVVTNIKLKKNIIKKRKKKE